MLRLTLVTDPLPPGKASWEITRNVTPRTRLGLLFRSVSAMSRSSRMAAPTAVARDWSLEIEISDTGELGGTLTLMEPFGRGDSCANKPGTVARNNPANMARTLRRFGFSYY